MPIAKVNGIDIYYEVEGTGQPLVLIGGMSCDVRLWDYIRTKLAKHFQLVAFDNRGSGRSSSPDSPYSIQDMAFDTALLLDLLGIAKAHVLGFSMGGAIAQMLAYQKPALVDKLILCHSLIKLTPPSALGMKFLLDLHRMNINSALLAEGVAPWLFSSRFLADPQKVAYFVESIVKNLHPQSFEGHFHQLNALMGFDSTQWLDKILSHTLVIAGEDDFLCPIEQSKSLSENIPQALLIALPKMAHMSLIEIPNKLNKILLDFLA